MESSNIDVPPNDQVSYRLWVGELRGDQVVACECYIAILEMKDHQQTMCIEEQRTIAKPV